MGRMRDRLEDDGGEPGIDMSPLIDCVFILLIFFIVTTVFVEETGIEIDKPEAAAGVQLEKTSILIAVSAKGQVVYGGKEIGVSGVRSEVKRLVRGDVEDMPVIIQADREAKADVLVRVIDEAKLGGAKKISISTQGGG